MNFNPYRQTRWDLTLGSLTTVGVASTDEDAAVPGAPLFEHPATTSERERASTFQPIERGMRESPLRGMSIYRLRCGASEGKGRQRAAALDA